MESSLDHSQAPVPNLYASSNGSSALGQLDDETFQVIDENKHYNSNVSAYFKAINIDKCGLNYHIVSVFGSQSTGKSTLLNALFGTKFDVMNEVQRRQTTKGIWMAHCRKKAVAENGPALNTAASQESAEPNLLIMDVEGTDGRERGEDQDFERKSALFALATSEVLIVNMWENQVGLYQGANMGLLKTVFEVNLSLFHTSAQKNRSLIMFVIRDHIGTTPLSNLQNTIVADLNRIWESLSKPEAAATSKLGDFFDLQFFTLPHKILMPDQFASQTATLSQYFINTSSYNYLFKPEYHRNVPLDGWPMYSQQIWEQIEQNKDLDLPTQQTLVARFRCEEIASQSWQTFESGLVSAQKDLDNSLGGPEVVDSFGEIVSSLRNGTLELYDSLASRYAKPVYLDKRDDLQAKIDTRLNNLYKAQLLALHKSSVKLFKTLIKAAQRQASTSNSVPFIDVLDGGNEKALDYFLTGAKKSSVDSSVFTYDEEYDALKRELADISSQAKAAEIKRISTVAIKRIKTAFDNDLETYFSEPRNDTWDQILTFFNNTVFFALTSVTTKYKTSTTNSKTDASESGYDFGVGGNDIDNAKGARDIRRKAWLLLDSELKQITRDENVLFRLREKFEDLFKYDSNGVPIVWKAGDDIETPYVKARDESLKMLPIFATARLKNGELLVPDLPKIEDDLNSNLGRAEEIEDEDKSEEHDEEESRLDPEVFPYRITSAKEAELSKRFKKQVDASFIEAKRSTTQMAHKVPFYMIILIVVLGWNEFMAVLRNPFLFLFALFAGAGAYVAFTLNLWGPILSVSNAMFERSIEIGKEKLRDFLEVPEGAEIGIRRREDVALELPGKPKTNGSAVEEIPLQDMKKPISSVETSEY